MVLTSFYAIAIFLMVIYFLFPSDFMTLLANPRLMILALYTESRRRWLLAKIGSQLWIETKMRQYSLQRRKSIMNNGQTNQQQQPNDR